MTRNKKKDKIETIPKIQTFTIDSWTEQSLTKISWKIFIKQKIWIKQWGGRDQEIVNVDFKGLEVLKVKHWQGSVVNIALKGSTLPMKIREKWQEDIEKW